MEKKTLKLDRKLVLGKETILDLDRNIQAQLRGGSDTCDCPVLTPYQTLICPTINPPCTSAEQKVTTCCK